MNGAAATVFSNVVQYYVAGLTPIIGPGAVAYTPQIGSVPNGVTMTGHASRLGRPPLRANDAQPLLQYE